MVKLYLHTHNANNSFKKPAFIAGLLLFLIIGTNQPTAAQCLPAPVVNRVPNQVLCHNRTTVSINFTGTATSYT